MLNNVLALLLSLHLLAPCTAFAQEHVKTALDYSLRQYGFMLGVALMGGLVSWFSKVRTGELQAWSLHHLIGELATSSMAGLVCFWICEWAGVAPLLTAALVGISGHMGTRAIALFEAWATRKFGAITKEPGA